MWVLIWTQTALHSDSVSEMELWIGNIHKEYEGTFTYVVSNRYGTTSSRVYVKVLGRYSGYVRGMDLYGPRRAGFLRILSFKF